jgi:hypothetical protein
MTILNRSYPGYLASLQELALSVPTEGPHTVTRPKPIKSKPDMLGSLYMPHTLWRYSSWRRGKAVGSGNDWGSRVVVAGVDAREQKTNITAWTTGIASHYPFVVVRIACRVCSRRGAYRLARLAERFGPEISLRDLTERFSYDCLWRGRGAQQARGKRVRRLPPRR